MRNPQFFRQSLQVEYNRSPLADIFHQLFISVITVILFLPVIQGFNSIQEVVAQELDPGENDPIVPSARRTLFPDQHALLAAPRNPFTLQVVVDPVPVVNPRSGEGQAEGIGSKRSKGQLEMSGTFFYDGDLDLSETTLVITNVLDEASGAGELLPGIRKLTGQDLTLFPRSQGRNSARFQTPDGQKPKVRLDVRQRGDKLKVKLHIEEAKIIEPTQCKRDFYYGQADYGQEHAEKRWKKEKFSKRDKTGGKGDASTELTTRFFLFDDEHAPVELSFDNEPWTCKVNGRGEVKALRLQSVDKDKADRFARMNFN